MDEKQFVFNFPPLLDRLAAVRAFLCFTHLDSPSAPAGNINGEESLQRSSVLRPVAGLVCVRNQSSHPRLPCRRPAERLSPDNDALVVDGMKSTTKSSISKVQMEPLVLFGGKKRHQCGVFFVQSGNVAIS